MVAETDWRLIHDFHVHQALPKFTIHRAEEIEREGELENELIDHDEVSDCHCACGAWRRGVSGIDLLNTRTEKKQRSTQHSTLGPGRTSSSNHMTVNMRAEREKDEMKIRVIVKEVADAPFTTPCAARNIIMVRAVEKMKFCPEFSTERLVAILTDAFSYVFSVLSYCLTSYASLLNVCARKRVSGGFVRDKSLVFRGSSKGSRPCLASQCAGDCMGRPCGSKDHDTHFDSLEIDQRIHRYSRALVIRCIGFFPEFCPTKLRVSETEYIHC